jgi:hypothetical protein
VRHPLSTPYALGQRDRIPGCSAPWQSTCSTARAAETVIGLYKTELINLALRGLGSTTSGYSRPAETSRQQNWIPPTIVRMPASPRPASQQTESPDSLGRFNHARGQACGGPGSMARYLGSGRRGTSTAELGHRSTRRRLSMRLLALCPLQGFERTPSEVRCRSWPGPS